MIKNRGLQAPFVAFDRNHEVKSPGELGAAKIRIFAGRYPLTNLPDEMLPDAQSVVDESLWGIVGDAGARLIIRAREEGRLKPPSRSWNRREDRSLDWAFTGLRIKPAHDPAFDLLALFIVAAVAFGGVGPVHAQQDQSHRTVDPSWDATSGMNPDYNYPAPPTTPAPPQVNMRQTIIIQEDANGNGSNIRPRVVRPRNFNNGSRQ